MVAGYQVGRASYDGTVEEDIVIRISGYDGWSLGAWYFED